MTWKSLVVIIIVLLMHSGMAIAAEQLVIAVTLHPYYSFVTHIVEDKAKVIPVIQGDFNPHGYQPQPNDIKRLTDADVLVVNGIGHDEFVFKLLDAAQMREKIHLIYANEGAILLPIAGTDPDDHDIDSHTFISITSAIQQIYTISNALIAFDPANADAYRQNTKTYVATLRQMKADYMQRLADIPTLDLRCATTHGAYDYLLSEFGLEVVAVIEPHHGLKPTASQLRETIDQINTLNVTILFSEMDFPDQFVETVREATGVRIYSFSHISGGEYSKERFEEDMRHNLDTLLTALREAQ